MKRTRRIGLAIALGLAVAAMSPAPSAFAQVANSRKALTQTIHELNVDGTSLAKTLDFLRDSTGANLSVNWKVLEAAGVTKETPISMNVKELTLRKMLQMVLDQASPNLPVIFQVDDNVIQITTQEDADKQMITRVYSVDDLIMAPTNKQAPQLQLGNSGSVTAGNGGGGGGGLGGLGGGSNGGMNGSNGGSGGGIFGGNGNNTNQTQQPQKTPQERGDDLVALIRQVVRPTIWRENGGPATIGFFNGKLIVTAPASVQEAIGGPVDSGNSIRFGN